MPRRQQADASTHTDRRCVYHDPIVQSRRRAAPISEPSRRCEGVRLHTAPPLLPHPVGASKRHSNRVREGNGQARRRENKPANRPPQTKPSDPLRTRMVLWLGWVGEKLIELALKKRLAGLPLLVYAPKPSKQTQIRNKSRTTPSPASPSEPLRTRMVLWLGWVWKK